MYFLLRSIRQPLNFILVFSKEAPRLIIHTRVSFKSPRVHLRAYVRSKYIHVSTCLIIEGYYLFDYFTYRIPTSLARV
jgi:hypothetical protein